MNILAAEAELAVRGFRWGDGLGGVAAEDPDFVQMNTDSYFSSIGKSAKEHEDLVSRMVAKLLASIE